MMQRFAKIVNKWKPLTIFAKHSSFDVWQGSEYASDVDYLKPLLQATTILISDTSRARFEPE